MTRKFALTALLLIAIFPALQASTDNRKENNRPDRHTLQEENEQYRHTIDSLLQVIEIMQRQLLTEDSLVEDILPEASKALYQRDYDIDEADSLIDAWYRNRSSINMDTDEFNMDSVQFTSAVSDSVMIQKLSLMNSFITLPFNETVKNYIILYTEKRREQVAGMLGLGNYYLPIFEETFDRYGMPLELKYMAIIESALNPTAVSRAGACGMWQFMYRTARSYGLEISSFVDERLDVEKAADAAARYLADAYRVFGDWNLAISSYNCGVGNVQKAIRRAGSTRFWDIYPFLPRETRGYVPAFVGAMYAMTYYKDYNIIPSEMGMPAIVDTFEIHKNLHFKQIESVVGIPLETLRQLNPQYTHDIVPGNGGTYRLTIPFNWSAAFMSAEPDSLYNHKADSLFNPQVLKEIQSKSNGRVAYRVKSGDYLGRIATRYHVSVKQLMSWNHLRSTNLRVGQILYIYGGTAPQSGTSSKSSSPSKSKPAASTATPAGKQTESATGQSTGGYTVYTVKSGDTLYSIARNYPGVSAQNIMDYNHIGSNIKVGMKIRIPASQSR